MYQHDLPPFGPLYFAALRESQLIARKAIGRLEALCAQFPDPDLRDGIDALRKDADKDRGRPADEPDLSII